VGIVEKGGGVQEKAIKNENRSIKIKKFKEKDIDVRNT
jgi:hypothetical protein